MDQNQKKPKRMPKQKIWQEMDDLQQKFYINGSGDENQNKIKATKSKYRKFNRQKKIEQVSKYEKALQNHRKSCNKFCDPFTERKIELHIEKNQLLRLLQDAAQLQKDVDIALGSIGLKPVKKLFKYNARQHILSAIAYISERKIPQWMIVKHEELLHKKIEDLKQQN